MRSPTRLGTSRSSEGGFLKIVSSEIMRSNLELASR